MDKKFKVDSDPSPKQGIVKTYRIDGVIESKNEQGIYAKLFNGSDSMRVYIPYGNVYERPPLDPPAVDLIEYLYIHSQIFPIINRDALGLSAEVLATTIYETAMEDVEFSTTISSIFLEVVVNYVFIEHTEDYIVRGGITDVGNMQVFAVLSYRSLDPWEDSMSFSATALSINIERIVVEYENYKDDKVSLSATMLGIDLI